MENVSTIPADQNLPLSQDAVFLKEEGIKLIQQFSGEVWTDYNDHDPGITLLEQLCFSLTDISYRCGFGIEKILEAGRKGLEDTFFDATRIFPSAPVTIADYRKLLIDQVGEIKNVWIEPQEDLSQALPGVYLVYLQLEDGVTDEQGEKIKEGVRQLLAKYRNLSEDFGQVEVLEHEDISISVNIELAYNAMGEEVLGKLLAKLEDYLSPPIRKQSLQDLLEAGHDLSDVLDGPLLHHGHIEDEDLPPRINLIRRSKIVEIISSIKGVDRIKGVEIRKKGIPEWDDVVQISENAVPRLSHYLNAVFENETGKGKRDAKAQLLDDIMMWKAGKRYQIDMSLVNQIYASHASRFQKTQIQDTHASLLPQKRQSDSSNPPLDIRQYFSLQNFLPAVYGIGQEGLGHTRSLERKAQTRQLKAYLLIFEQLLVNYLAQLAELSSLFSTSPEIDQTYFSQPPFEIPNVEAVLRNEERATYREEIKGPMTQFKREMTAYAVQVDWEEVDKVLEEQALEQEKGFDEGLKGMISLIRKAIFDKYPPAPDEHETSERERLLSKMDEFRLACIRATFRANLDRLQRKLDPFFSRRNQFLNHLLARFSESLSGINSRLLVKDNGQEPEQALIDNKLKLLRNYVSLSQNRSQGPGYEEAEPSALQLRLGTLLGFDPNIRSLAAFLNPSQGKRIKVEDKKTDDPPPAGRKKFRFELPKKERRHLLAALVSHGLHEYNYDIVPREQPGSEEEAGKTEKDGPSPTGFLLKFHNPMYGPPQTLALADSEEEAQQARDALVRYLNQINMQGEGCHLVEHTLLRPMGGDLFRFVIYGGDRRPILTSFELREEDTQQYFADNIILFGLAEKEEDDNPGSYINYKAVSLGQEHWELHLMGEDKNGKRVPVAKVLNGKGTVSAFDSSEEETQAFSFPDEEAAKARIEKVVRDLKEMQRRKLFSSRIQLLAEEKEKLDSDFYAQRCSLVLPNWPSRFQSPDFQKQLEALLMAHAPAHLAFHLLWLGPEEMVRFEARQEAWRKQLRANGIHARDAAALDLARLLKGWIQAEEAVPSSNAPGDEPE
jgi:hypothetical protein